MNANPKLRYFTKLDLTTPQPKGNHDEFSVIEKRLIELPPVFPSQKFEPIKSSCFCKNPQLPCDCKCKQCLLPFDTMSQNYMQHGDSFARMQNSEYIAEDRLKDSDNTLNIRIKVDIQLPKTQETIGRFFKNRSREDIGNSKESSLNLPFPYFNFPIPMDVFGYKRMSKVNSHDSGHKIAVHKKKKSRVSSGSKKHRKKIVNFHNLNIQPQASFNIQSYVDESFNWTDVNVGINNTNQVTTNNTIVTHKLETNVSNSDANAVNKTTESPIAHETQTEESIFVMVNITNSGDNTTEDVHKIENSVETEFPKVDTNVPTEKLSNKRKKREISKKNTTEKSTKKVTNHTNQKIIKKPTTHKTSITAKSKLSYNKPSSINPTGQNKILTNEFNKKDDTKKSDKLILSDAELVYWPTVFMNQSNVHSRNITTIILERENKKAKVNMTKEAIRNNRTRALERAIFGDINWDDVDTVAPVFMSFVGKYLRGVLTFCSQNVCHSMKCADKTCVHRVCVPNDRWNHRGHCSGSNETG